MAYVVNRRGRWTGYYRVGDKRLSAGTWDTKTEAEYHALVAEREGLKTPLEGSQTLSEWVAIWLPQSDLLPNTRKGYQRVLNTYILPQIGQHKIVEISTKLVSKLLADLKAEGVGSATLGQVKACLGSALKPLVATGDLPANPTHGVSVRQRKSDLAKVIEPEEFKEVVSYLPTEGAKLFVRFLMASGCRFGEATELRVSDVDFKSGEVYVQRRVCDLGNDYDESLIKSQSLIKSTSKSRSNTKSHSKSTTKSQSNTKSNTKRDRFIVLDSTKSGRKRYVTLSKALLQDIKQYVIAKALSKDDLLFSRSIVVTESKINSSLGTKSLEPYVQGGKKFQHGTLYSYTRGNCRCGDCKEAVRKYRQKAKPHQKRSSIDQTSHLPRDVWRKTWNKAIANSKIGWYPRTHDLRHANATQLLKNGVDLHEVKERLGHQSIRTTERYLHRIRQNKSQAPESVNDYVG